MAVLLRLLPVICLLVLQIATGCAPLPVAVLTTETDATGRPLNESSTFTPDVPRIICSLSTKGLAAPTEVAAVWSHYEGAAWKTVKHDRLTVGSSTYLPFLLQAPETGWPAGSYRVTLTAGQTTLAEKDFTLKADAAVSIPVINSFQATPGTVTAGRQFTLSWNVSGASRVVISPDIGSVEAGGSRLLSISSDRTYILTAVNSGGTSSMSVTVRAAPPEYEQGNIVIVDIFREASMVYYKIRNQGSGTTKACSAVIYVGPTKLAVDYIAPLKPGEERTEVFGTFSYSYNMDTPVTVCIDSESENGTGNKMNNCLIKLLPGVRTI